VTKEKSPAFQFYPKDLLSDPIAMGFNGDQFKAYMILLCYDWLDNGVPDDDGVLCRLGLLLDRKLLTPIRKKFIQHPDKKGVITNPRLIKERIKQANWKEKSSKGGKNSPTQFKAKDGPKDGPTSGGKDGPSMGTSSSSSSSSSSSIPSSVKSKDMCGKVIYYLNEKAGRNFKNIDTHHQWIRARIKEGFKLEDFMKVVDTQVKLWKDDPGMNRFLRPYTLFGNKMDGYLNTQPDVEKKRPKSKAEEKREVGDSWLKKRRDKNDRLGISAGSKGILE
jgi:uncharacterized phage protein (TIGR02220 family)